jgi:RNA polymerase sigma-70 factor (ECF subfamily)
LRALARSLLRDEHAAEDVVQETWLACLRHPGVVPRRLSAWLGTVTSRLALRRQRGEGRRAARERQAAAPERLEAVQQRTLEREEALRAVTAALLALEEPFKSTLVLRFVEERTPSEIAAELELPLTTVKSRIARGLERMRARLALELGDEARRTRALALLAGLAPRASIQPTIPASTLTAASGAAAKLALGLGAVAVLGGAGWWWTRTPASGAQPPLVALDATKARAEDEGAVFASFASGGAQAPSSATVGQRESLAAEVSAEDEAEARLDVPTTTYSFRLSGRVRDEYGLPLADARVLLGPPGLALHETATTDAEGRFALAFRARRPALAWGLAVEQGGRGLALRELTLSAGQDLELDLGLGPASEAQQAWLALESKPALVVDLAEDVDAAQEPALVDRAMRVEGTMASMFATASSDAEVVPALRDKEGRVVFLAPPVQSAPRLMALMRAMDLEVAGRYAGVLSYRAGTELVLSRGHLVPLYSLALEGISFEESFAYTPSMAPPTSATVRGRVRASDGSPLAGIRVGWGPPAQALATWTESDASGAFELVNVPEGEHQLHAGGGGAGRAQELATLRVGDEHVWNPVLERGAELAGRVRLASGEALAGLRIELWSTSPHAVWCDATLTDVEGRYRFANVPAGALELQLFTAEAAFPLRVVAPVYATLHGGVELEPLVLDARELALHALAAELRAADDTPVANGELRVWHEDGRRGRSVRADAEGRVQLAGLPIGGYRFEARSRDGWRDLGRVWVEADVELGLVRFPEPQRFAWWGETPRAAGSKASLWLATPDAFARVAAESECERELFLPPGAYVRLETDAAGKRRNVPLVVPERGALAAPVADEARCDACHGVSR